jgi:hypothetical protein
MTDRAVVEDVSRFSIDDPSLPSSHPAAMTSDATTSARNTPRVRRSTVTACVILRSGSIEEHTEHERITPALRARLSAPNGA